MEVRYEYTLDQAVEALTWVAERSPAGAQRLGRALGCLVGFLIAVPAYEVMLRLVRATRDGANFFPGEIDMLHPIRWIAILAALATVALVWIIGARSRALPPGTPQRWAAQRRLRQALQPRFEGGRPVATAVAVDAAGIHTDSQGVRVTYDWANLLAVEWRKRDVVLCLRFGAYVFVPERAFLDAAQQDEFVHFVEDHLGQRQPVDAPVQTNIREAGDDRVWR